MGPRPNCEEPGLDWNNDMSGRFVQSSDIRQRSVRRFRYAGRFRLPLVPDLPDEPCSSRLRSFEALEDLLNGPEPDRTLPRYPSSDPIHTWCRLYFRQ